MRMYDLIEKKKLGMELTTDEIRFMIDGFTDGTIPDYQMSAMTMAICFQGMSKRETVDLTLAMRDSGDVQAVPRDKFPKKDWGCADCRHTLKPRSLFCCEKMHPESHGVILLLHTAGLPEKTYHRRQN